MTTVKFHRIADERRDEFVRSGYQGDQFFAHSIHYLPKCGPNGLKLSQGLWREHDPNKSWEVVIYADSSVAKEFPDELFFDHDIGVHRQHFGQVGQVATANILVTGDRLFGTSH